MSAPRSICSCLASTLADFHQPYQGCWPPQDLRILLRLHPPSSQSSVNIKFQSNRKRRQKSNLIELVKYWCFDTHSTITCLANWTCDVSDSFLSVLNAGFLCSTLPYTLYSCLVIRLSCDLPRRSKSCQPSTWRNPDANCYSAVLRLCAAISSSRTALLCRSVTHWEYNSNWADLRYGGEVQIVAQKRLFGLVWPDTFHCGSQCWWVGGSRSRKRAREKGSKIRPSLTVGDSVSVLIQSVMLAPLMTQISKGRPRRCSFSDATWLASSPASLTSASNCHLDAQRRLLSLSAYTVLKYEKLH